MSDVEDMTESESGDFSPSEDEWVPEKKRKPSTSSSVSSDDKASSPDNVKRRKTPVHKKSSQKTTIPKSVTKTIAPQKATAKYHKHQNNDDDDESSSSGDDCLVDPSKLDLNSDFFAASTSASTSVRPPPAFKVQDKLSDMSDDGDDVEQTPRTVRSFEQNEQFIKNLERAKALLEDTDRNDAAAAAASSAGTIDIGQLLQMGESKPSSKASVVASTSKSAKHAKADKRKAGQHSDSDWEEVSDTKAMRPDEIVTTINLGPQLKAKPNRTQLELEAQLKRALNRRKKDTQLLMHKVHILCCIGHGNYVNRVLNNAQLMQQCLKFMPSKFTYPKERTDRTYFEQISKWYASQMKLAPGAAVDAPLSRMPALPISLDLQLRSQVAISKKSFVLMFVLLLRAIGVQCRLVINLVTVPMRPAASEMCSIALKEETKSSIKSSGKGTQPDQIAKKASKEAKATKTAPKAGNTSKGSSDKSTASTSVSPHFSVSNSEIRSTKSDLNRVSVSKPTKAEPTKSTTSSSSSSRNKTKPETVSPHFSDVKAAVRLLNPLKTVSSRTPEKEPKSSAPASTSSVQSTLTLNAKKRPHLNGADPVPVTTSAHFAQSNATNILNGSPISKRTRSARPKRTAGDRPHLPQLDGAGDGVTGRQSTRKRTASAKKTAQPLDPEPESEDSDSDSDFEDAPKKKIVVRQTAAPKPKSKRNSVVDRRLLSTDDDNAAPDDLNKASPKKGMNLWVEVYSEAQEQWMCIDLFKLKVLCVDTIRAALTKPINYVLAWNNDGTVRDVSARYCTNWNTTTRRQRIDAGWLSTALRRYRPRATFATRTEDLELDKLTAREPLPTTIGEFKNHPLYALQRHLLKFEGIYPADAPALGFIRGEQVYARDCVHTLHSRDIWLKSALVVRPGESAYKVVKARPRWDRQTNKCLEPQPLEIFGHWQTQAYDPPTAENGIVPRNAYGNVELFKPEMLPKKTVHLQLPGLNRTCKRMKIDCAQAVTGFDFHSGSCHPTFDGFVVCEEFAVQVEEQYWLDQEEAQRKDIEKYEARVYGNWKKLIKGLLIRQRLQKKYKFADGDAAKGKPPPPPEEKVSKGRRL